MPLKIYQVDAFSDQVFSGNPAAVCPLEEWLPTHQMQKIALENNLSETAFFIPSQSGFEIRWFTPAIEVDLCGHATLAAAHVLFHHLDFPSETIRFDSRSGPLRVKRVSQQYILDFPADSIRQIDSVSKLEKALGVAVTEVWRGKDDIFAIVGSEAEVKGISPDFEALKQLGSRGVLVSAKGESVDFVSRCFFPNAGILEDPVTGSAHTSLTPYWTRHLGERLLKARQLSERGGVLHCQLLGDRVSIAGNAVTFMEGVLYL